MKEAIKTYNLDETMNNKPLEINMENKINDQKQTKKPVWKKAVGVVALLAVGVVGTLFVTNHNNIRTNTLNAVKKLLPKGSETPSVDVPKSEPAQAAEYTTRQQNQYNSYRRNGYNNNRRPQWNN